ncbi:hypothetical protein [Erythrobacter sp. Alg231-14]
MILIKLIAFITLSIAQTTLIELGVQIDKFTAMIAMELAETLWLS